jgi:hypothetical protein
MLEVYLGMGSYAWKPSAKFSRSRPKYVGPVAGPGLGRRIRKRPRPKFLGLGQNMLAWRWIRSSSHNKEEAQHNFLGSKSKYVGPMAGLNLVCGIRKMAGPWADMLLGFWKGLGLDFEQQVLFGPAGRMPRYSWLLRGHWSVLRCCRRASRSGPFVAMEINLGYQVGRLYCASYS